MIMKNLHISMAFIFVLLLITASCSDKDDSAPRVIPTMNLTVSEIGGRLSGPGGRQALRHGRFP